MSDLAPGLTRVTLPYGERIRCSSCGCSVTLPHIPGGLDCEEALDERRRSQRR